MSRYGIRCFSLFLALVIMNAVICFSPGCGRSATTAPDNTEQSASVPSSDIQRAPIEEATSSGDAEQSVATPSSDIQRAPIDEEDSQLEPGNTIKLISMGEERTLPRRLLGLQVVPFYERLTDSQVKRSIARDMAPAFIRFPGGTVGNYYNWRTGLLEVPAENDSSAYTLYFVEVADFIRGLHPQGISIEQYHEFSEAIGAEIVLVANLETSTIPEQVAWFEHMKQDGIIPRRIELGNEFWVAMLGDPNVLEQWPDVTTAMRVMKDYRDALLPYFAEDTLVAIQAAGSRFFENNLDGELIPMTHLKDWDASLSSKSWFDAVTLHFYLDVDRVAGPGERANLPQNIEEVFPAMMARCDSGLEETLNYIEKRLPGKEIWITEWSGKSGPGVLVSQKEGVIYGMNLHLTTRMVMAMLRNESVTLALYHMLNFSGGTMSLYAYDSESGGYVPIGPATILTWFNHAANGGVTYQRLKVEGAKRITSSTTALESYYDIEAALFKKGEKATIIIHNASAANKNLELSHLMEGRLPTKIEVVIANLDEDYSGSIPAVQTVTTGNNLELPPYSVTRLLWE